MKVKQVNVTWASILLVFTIVLVGLLAFRHFMNSLVYSQHQIFVTNAEASLESINSRILNLSNQLESYTELPSFGEIYYHQLTMNQAAVNQNKRSLEIYFFSLHRREPGYSAISFIDVNGREQMRISEQAIRNVYRDFSAEKVFQHFKENAHQESLLQLNDNQPGQAKTISWWLPIQTSASKRLGYLKFDIKFELLKKVIEIDSWDKEMLIDLVDADDRSLLTGEPVIKPMVKDFEWSLKLPLPLPGLDWNVQVRANQEILLDHINTINAIGLYLVFPLLLIMLLALVFFAIRHQKAEKNIHHMAFHDMLTGLVNRHEFEWRLDNAIESAQQNDYIHAVLYMDLDHFKLVNDTAGHVAGDELLRQLSSQLKNHVRETDTLARLGGDEFALLLEQCLPERAERIANNIVSMMREYKFSWDRKTFDIGISIGLVLFDKNTLDHDEVLRHADLACYRAKDSGRNRVQIYNAEDNRMLQHHGEMEYVNRIKKALDNDSFELHAQVIESLQGDEDTITWEILVRLRENDNLITPNSFIPAAERFGLMAEIDRWVVRQALAQYDRLSDLISLGKKYRFFINLSGASLSDETFLGFVRKELKKRKIPKGAICFEITETAAIINLTELVEFIEEIQGEGYCFALDDFGAGLSSFSYLKMIPVDFLKIDGTFVQSMTEDKMSHSIVESINKIGHSVNIRTIAEFVTDQQRIDELSKLGIDYAQGYGIHYPQALSEMINNEFSIKTKSM
jgi:diguanylate cyclase (GGDEF)-like protein